MAIINCKECGNEISDKAEKCPNCGYPIKEIKNKKNNTLITVICIFIFAFCISIAMLFETSNVSNNNLETVNTYTIGKINYSVPKELTLVNNGDKHEFMINDSALLLIGGFFNDSNYKLNNEEREIWYQSSINALIGNDNATSSIENISINNNVWKKVTYLTTNDSGETIDAIAFVLLDKNSEYYYAISLSQVNNINDEFVEILENVMESITFISSDNSSEQTNNFSKVTKENYDKIKEGMSKSEVLSILGEPESVSESETSGLGTMELCHFQEGLSLKAIDVYFVNGSVYMKNWTDL